MEGALDWAVSLYAFEGRAAQAVKRLKYARVTALAKPMADLMEHRRQELPDHDAIAAVPIHPSRRRSRGFNQSELLCEAMPRDLLRHASVLRIRKTRPQVELTRAERRVNLQGAFDVLSDLSGMKILLIDDVVTSGGTALACAEALKQQGAVEVGLLTFCGERLDLVSDR